MRAFASLTALVTKDADQRQKFVDQLLSFDDADPATCSTFGGPGLVTLAASASNIAVAFGGVTLASMVLIIAYQNITVKFEGTGSPAVPVRVTPAVSTGAILSNLQRADQPGLVLWRGKVSSIHLGNPSSTTAAQAYIALVGEAAA